MQGDEHQDACEYVAMILVRLCWYCDAVFRVMMQWRFMQVKIVQARQEKTYQNRSINRVANQLGDIGIDRL